MSRLVFITTLILIAMSMGTMGCQLRLNTSATNSTQRPYDYEANLLHAESSLIPAGRDSLDVFVEWDREECLYLRDDPASPFFAHLSMNIGGLETSWLDTLESGIEQSGRKTWRVDRLDIGAPWQEGATTVKASFIDHHRNSNYPWRALIPAWESIAHPYTSDGWPLFGRHATSGDTVYFSAPIGSKWQHASVEVPHRLPSPPFTRSNDQTDTLQPKIRSDWKIDDSGWSGYIIQPGINVLGMPNSAGKIDVTQVINGVDFDFPHVRDVRLLIASSRYISSRGEFQRMEESSDPKAALDAFWLNCGNNKESAAELIKIYYSRVEEANRFFSGVVPGWKTDRGMVHIVFGIPDKIRRTNDSEWWLYGEEGSTNAINMRFLRQEHPWDPSFYKLGRSIQYRIPWDRMVTNWRNGRIQPD
jgi:GWxTD domain-containing protein